MRRLAPLASTMTATVRRWQAMLADWAASRALAASSLSGVGLLLALCAATWFSGGTSIDMLWGMVALCGWLLVRVVAVRLLALSGGAAAGAGVPAGSSARPPSGGSTDWMILPGRGGDGSETRHDHRDQLASATMLVTAAAPEAVAAAGIAREAPAGAVAWSRSAAIETSGFNSAWLYAISALAGECAICGGVAAGGQSDGWTGMWPLAVATIISIALTDMLIACSGAAAAGGLAKAIGANSPFWRWTGRLLPSSAGRRVALIALGLLVHGPRVALALLLASEVASIGLVSLRLGRLGIAGRTESPRAANDMVMACRNDGALARWAGRLVQGNIMPLPSICAGLCALVLLAVLGLGNMPGVVALAPAMALLLAAPGSAHRHDGRFDWLAPVLLALSQYIYLAALGFARHVSGPLVFSLCALTAIWYANLAASAPASGAERPWMIGSPKGLGWESRMFVVTFAAMVGIATVGYLGLTMYLGVLICRKVVAGLLASRESDDV